MGHNNSKQQQQQAPKQIDPTDQLIDLQMTIKRLERESKKSQKEAEQQTNRARQAVEKGQDDAARLYLQNAVQKQNSSKQLLHMSMKLDMIRDQIRSNMHNTEMVQQLNKVTPYLQQFATEMPFEQMGVTIDNFNTALNNISVNAKIMNEMLNNNAEAAASANVDQAFQQLKNEVLIKQQLDMQTNPQLLNQITDGQKQQAPVIANPVAVPMAAAQPKPWDLPMQAVGGGAGGQTNLFNHVSAEVYGQGNVNTNKNN